MSACDDAKTHLREQSYCWLITGAAGFIGSHLVENLLALGQKVIGLDDLSSGRAENLEAIPSENFTFIKGDIRDSAACEKACAGVDYVLHHAAIGSVVKSIEEPELVNAVNVGGFTNILQAAERAGVRRVVYASSSAVYGDGGDEPRREGSPLSPKSPYAESKIMNEFDAASANIQATGLRYFNIYGPRQDPNGAYAAVIPRWIEQMRSGQAIEIYGDGKTVRDFCHVDDVVQANILAALTDNKEAIDSVFNIGSGEATTLNKLFYIIQNLFNAGREPVYKEFREGDIRISQADISKAKNKLGFTTSVSLENSLKVMVELYKK